MQKEKKLKDMDDSSVCLKIKSLVKIWLNISRIFLTHCHFLCSYVQFSAWVLTNQVYNQESSFLCE